MAVEPWHVELDKLVPFTFTWWQSSTGHSLVHSIYVVVQVSSGCPHHSNPRACAQRVQITAIVISHGVPILHDRRAAVYDVEEGM